MTVVLLTTLLATCAAKAASNQERITLDGPAWAPPLIRRLAVCESNGDPRHHVVNREGEFEGIVSWARRTWDMDRSGISRADHAYQASLRQQVRVAVVSVRRHRSFGCLRYQWVRG